MWSATFLFMVGQYLLVWALNCILVMHGWPLWSVCKNFDLITSGMKNLPSHVMQECSLARSSFSCQKGFRIMGRLLQCSGQPSNIFWMKDWSVWSPWVAIWICSKYDLVRCRVSSSMVTAKLMILPYYVGWVC